MFGLHQFGRMGFVPKGSAFNPASALFGAGEQGGLWNIALMSSLFQDSAGATPVTAVEQPVGRIVDQSGRGNHLIQATSASRPTYSARYNLVNSTENITTGWVNANNGTGLLATLTQNYPSIAAPDGTFTYQRIQMSLNGGTSSSDRSGVNQNIGMASTTVYGNFWARTVSGTAVVQVRAGNYIEELTFTETPQLVTFTGTSNGDPFFYIWLRGAQSPACSDAADLLIWHPDLRRPIDTVGQPAYQRVTSSTDYDTTGFYPYLRCDGADDGMYSAASIDFSATDEMNVFVGLTKLSDVATAIPVELSADLNSNNGVFYILAPNNPGTSSYLFRSKGTISSAASYTNISAAAPVSNVFTGIGDVSSDVSIVRLNGTQVASGSGDQGAGNYGNYVLFVGRRNNVSFPFDGRIYSLIARGALTSGTDLTNTERWIAQRMPGNLIV